MCSRVLPIKIKILSKTAKIPTRADNGASGYDLYADTTNRFGSLTVLRGGWHLIKTGIALSIPPGFEGQIRPRSGLALKNGITVLNTPGTIDSSYRGEIGVILQNHSLHDFYVKQHMRIAQIVFAPVYIVKFEIVDFLEETERGVVGFGSSGNI